jgi:hypothetical protein
MRRILILAALGLAAVAAAREPVGTTTGGPLTVSGVPIYGIAANGDLFWYFHQGAHNGAVLWAHGGQRAKVGSGWNDGLRVFKGSPSGGDGVIYRVDSHGDLYWYRHLGHATGTASWVDGKKVGGGWQVAHTAFAAGNGIVYLAHKNGDLLWYRHLGYRDGRAEWANGGTGAKVGSGWGDVRFAFAGGNGVIYTIDSRGDLYWYRHLGQADGKFAWAHDARGIKIGNGWGEVVSAFSGGDGLIYAMKRDGSLFWYKNTGFATGAGTWATPTGNKVGSGWQEMVRIF